MSDKMLDLDNLRDQLKNVTEKVMTDMTLVREHTSTIDSVVILLADVILLQAIQGSLTLAFLERWADETAEPAEEES